MHKVSHDSETPADGQQVITACAVIHRTVNGVRQILLPRRADTKKFLPGQWELVGGHIDYGEDIIEGLKRETLEELGVRITVGDPFACFTYVNHIKNSHSIEVVYFAELIDSPEMIQIHPEDHSEFRWVTEKEFEGLTPFSGEERRNVEKAFSLLKGESLSFG